MLTIDFLKECTKINNKNESLKFTYTAIKNHPDKMLICIGHKHLKQLFFCTLDERTDDNNNIVYDLNLLKNDKDSTEEFVNSYTDAQGVRRGLIGVIKEMYPLEKSEKSKEYCYPRCQNEER